MSQFAASLPIIPLSALFGDAQTVFINCTPGSLPSLLLPASEPGVMRIVIGHETVEQVSQGMTATTSLASTLERILSTYARARDDIRDIVIFIDAITSTEWQRALDSIDPCCLPAHISSLGIVATPFHGLRHVLEERYFHELGEAGRLTSTHRVRVSPDGLFLLPGNSGSRTTQSLEVTSGNYFQSFSYEDQASALRAFLSSAADLITVEIPQHLCHSAVFHFLRACHLLSSLTISTRHVHYDDPSSPFGTSDLGLLRTTFAATIRELHALETLTFPAVLMSRDLLLAMCRLPNLKNLTVLASPRLRAEDTIVNAAAGFVKPLPKMTALNSLTIEVHHNEQVEAPLQRRTKAMTPNAERRRIVVGSSTHVQSPALITFQAS